jgi:uncharacterized protein (TIGR00369 family)
MEIRNPDYKQTLADIFRTARFVQDVGIELVDSGPGWVETRLTVLPRHLQQNDFIHAGVQATLADHTAGGAAFTLIASEQIVLTSSFTLHLLNPALGEALRCRSEVLRAGRRLIVAESDVYAVSGGREQRVSKATVSLSVVDKKK